MNIYDGIAAENLIRVSCPFCSSSNAESVRPLADITRCNACGAVYLRTRLNDRALERLYQSYAETGSHMDPPKNQAETLSSPLRRDSFLTELMKYTKPPAALLDIGCGWGAFIHNAAGRGFLVKGIEITEKSSDFGRKKLGLDIESRRFTEINYPDESLDAVSMIHSLEHLPEPVMVVRKVYSILKQGGIFFGAVPNFGSFASEVLGDRWEWLDPYHHIIHYYPAFLDRFLQLEGFEILKIETVTGDFNRVLLGEIVRKYYKLNSEKDITNKITELEKSLKGEEIRFTVQKKVMKKVDNLNDSNMEKFRKLDITIRKGDDYEAIIHGALMSVNEPVHLVIHDLDNSLPKSSENWNGVTIIKGGIPAGDNLSVTSAAPERKSVATESRPMNRVQFKSDLEGGFSNKKATGRLPVPLPKPLALNLGCGRDVKEGFVNIDLFSDNPNVVGMDVRKLELPDNCADFILASDILEHFPHRETDNILKEWARVLKPDAELMIRCPSLKLQAEAYMAGVWNADVASYMIFGGQTNPGDYHCAGFDERTITARLDKAAMDVIEILEHKLPQTRGYINLNMTVRAKKRVHAPDKTSNYYLDEIFGSNKSKPEAIAGESGKQDNQSEISAFDFSGGEQPAAKIENTEELKPQLNIVWEGSQFVYHSLALINREMCYNIIKSGVAEVTAVPYENDAFEAGSSEKYNTPKKNDIRFKKESPAEIQKQIGRASWMERV